MNINENKDLSLDFELKDKHSNIILYINVKTN